MIVGILGVGHLASSLLEGFHRAGLPSQSILLSGRGKSAELSAAYGLEICGEPHELVSRSDVVILAVRPDAVSQAVTGLPWRENQVLISVCAGVALSAIAAYPAKIVRAMPLTAAEINKSPTVFFPDVPEVRDLIGMLGPAIALGSEHEFDVATVNAAIYGWAQDLVRQSVAWSSAQGADPSVMRQLISRTFVAAGELIAERPESIEALLSDLVTPGGITELGLKTLQESGQPEAWSKACEAVMKRLTGRG
jgi:pyrroline-5-carboxylate reductase